ncbi:hypothetical protein EH151_04160 [Elizabethkingia anophelis]|uniref:hypothetical protein n=1 Tax=Elizabethkingia anophelis TaxID=1117645 RepID=UPI00136C818F|nr:hypothetical protein [Elizabethkingia anophelis]MYZ59085.1 hypothetical protein [Elizabethkingia anophelis]
MDEEVILREKIVGLCYNFGFMGSQKEIVSLIFFTWKNKQAMDISDVRIEIIELIIFFRQCQENIRFVGEAKENNKDVRKGQVLKGSITSRYLTSNVENWLNTLLHDKIVDSYEHLGVKDKEQVEWGCYERYSDQELQQILKIEGDKKKRRDIRWPKSKNPYFGSTLSLWYDKLFEIGVFSENDGISGNKKFRFLYECMVLIGEFENDDSKLETDKSNKVRDCIKAYKKISDIT